MQQIILFFIRKRNFFVFLLLFSFSIFLIIKDNYYPQSRYINSANAISGSLYNFSSYWAQYFDLRGQNTLLSEENKQLRSKIFALENQLKQSTLADSLPFFDANQYKVYTANIIKNSFLRKKNYLTIDKGEEEGVKQDMGVISPKGIVGIVENTSGQFATVQSVLNIKSSLNAMVKRTGHFGSLKWNGQELNIVQLVDIPNIAPIQKGDTIVTGGMSSIFPKGIPVGRIMNITRSQMDNSFVIDIKLFTDMSNVDFIYIIENKDKEEISNLESQNPNE
ncbi:rod shape-determining protein MreC [Capnocytophaga stomatis]|uniref:Cell shape-determining protein MreC n=1 Tax=Capnocytophaga stomatis TaxID=1848904 RepID=A0A250FTX5_9FLAO|nr:rod shape-determining protein MreC [Capnocytophaga stomatis]ATA88553.1 rod shape-determining protein MreC [Capnocytophaga stomatis]